MEKINEFRQKISQSVTAKILTIGLLILILLIPINRIKNLIHEREQYRQGVIHEVSQKWGNKQTLAGPILTIPVYTTYLIEDKVNKIWKNLHILPEDLQLNVKLNPQIRHRGMYDVIVYMAEVKINGYFKGFKLNELAGKDYQAAWDKAYISIGIPDMRGVQNRIIFMLEENEYEAIPGVHCDNIIRSGFTLYTPLEVHGNSTKEMIFNLNLEINGSSCLEFFPLGKSTNVIMNSNWNNPSFNGSFLPKEYTIKEDKFSALWNVFNLNRNYPQYWFDNEHSIENSEFGVELMLPVDHYQKSMRSVKYALMFIFLTFIVFLFFEMINKKRIHPIQYLLVSAGLIIFYSLLLSLSEHIGFNYAYLISSIAIISLISFYTSQIFKKRKINFIFLIILISLYVFLFVILQLEDFALMMGSIGLFTILGLIMYYSRNVNWYSPLKKSNDSE